MLFVVFLREMARRSSSLALLSANSLALASIFLSFAVFQIAAGVVSPIDRSLQRVHLFFM